MKKIWSVITVGLLFSLMLSACHDSGISTEEPQKTPSEAASLEESPAPEDIPGSRGLEYALEGDSYVVVGIGWCGLSDIVIPAYHEGKPVSRIRDRAFMCCDQLKSVTIVNGVTSIGDVAFKQCKSLRRVVIPDSVTEIGTSAFLECINLQDVSFGTGLQTIGTSAFENCNLMTLDLPNSVTTIGDSAFLLCTGLKTVNLPDSVTAIGKRAFMMCTFEKIVISKNVLSIGADAFGCEEIYCQAENKPEGWDDNWSGNFSGVYWAGSWEYVDGVPTKK